MIRRLIWIAVMALPLLIAGGALGNLAERWLIYPLDSTYVSPADAGLTQMKEHRLTANDGERLVVWAATAKPGKPTILYFHGNAGNLAARAGRFRRFINRGYGVIALGYRGSSGSGGTPSEAALSLDAQYLYFSLGQILPAVRPENLVIYGESLGSAVAIHLMASTAADPVKGPGPAAAVILEAPFTSIPALAQNHYPAVADLAGHLDNRWDNLKWASHLHMPLLILHGTDDSLIPIEMGRQIFAAAPSREKHFVAVPQAGHSDLWRSDTLPQIWQFMDRYLVK